MSSWPPAAERLRSTEPSPRRSARRGSLSSRTGDKVIQVENDYDKEVYNRDIGYVVDLDLGPTASANSMS
jgi:ATP-dependent exoDNAse (exonuclease V) alpha subunit